MKPHYYELDFLRAFAIICVITIHVTSYYTLMVDESILRNFIYSINTFAHCAVPIFVFVSGLSLSLSYDPNVSIINFYKKRFPIFKTYLIWSILYIFFYKFFNTYMLSNKPIAINFNIKEALFQITHFKSSYHLWYFKLLLKLYIISPFIAQLFFFIKNKHFKLITVIAISIYQIFSLNQTKTTDWQLLSNYIAFFSIGLYSKDLLVQKNPPLERIIIAINSIILLATYFMIFNHIHNGKTLVERALLNNIHYFSLFIFLLLLSKAISKVKFKFKKLILEIGKYSFAIYLVHVEILELTINHLHKYNINQYNKYFYLVCLLSTVTLSFLFSKTINTTKYSNILIRLKQKSLD